MSTAETADPGSGAISDWLDAQGIWIALRLTLLDLLLAPIGEWSVRAPVLLLAGAGLIHAGVLRSPLTWFTLALLGGWRVVADWPLADNHAYLLAYWLLAAALALSGPLPRLDLARSARLLIGLSFAFAVLWKSTLSVDYVDERFFRHLLITDERFEEPAIHLGGMTSADLEAARALIEENRHVTDKPAPATLETPALRRLASLATWLTLLLESAVASLFLLPDRFRSGRLRDFTLMAFCATTYMIAPVPGFGWLLLAMGIAQCPEDARSTRWSYLACFGLVLLHDNVPWFGVTSWFE
jgi:hypothetical protein